MKSVDYRRSAQRALRKLPQEVQTRVEAALERYARTGEGNVKKLINVGGSRLRVGDYRAIFLETDKAVEVLAVGHRKDVYR